MPMTLESSMGWNSLMKAALDGSAAQVKAALAQGDKVNDKDTTGCTALHLAAMRGHLHIVELLLEEGADPLRKDDEGKTAQDMARRHGHIDIVYRLEQAAKEPPKIKPEEVPARVAELERTVAELQQQIKDLIALQGPKKEEPAPPLKTLPKKDPWPRA